MGSVIEWLLEKSRPTDAYMRQNDKLPLLQIMTIQRLFSAAKPLSEPTIAFNFQWYPCEQIWVKFELYVTIFIKELIALKNIVCIMMATVLPRPRWGWVKMVRMLQTIIRLIYCLENYAFIAALSWQIELVALQPWLERIGRRKSVICLPGFTKRKRHYMWVRTEPGTEFTNPTTHLCHIPQYTTLEQKCVHFCSKVVHCGIWDMYIVGFERLVNTYPHSSKWTDLTNPTMHLTNIPQCTIL